MPMPSFNRRNRIWKRWQGPATRALVHPLYFLTHRGRQALARPVGFLLLLTAPVLSAFAQPEGRVRPLFRFQPPAVLEETSGMVFWRGGLWQHADGGAGPLLYETDTADGRIRRTIRVLDAANRDWEDMAQDDSHVYVGDFGNNADGARRDLAVYRIRKADLAEVPDGGGVPAERIAFRYPDMPDTVAAPNRTDHDCEAMVCLDGRLLLFTKRWVSNGTVLYMVPAVPGEHVATRVDSFDTGGLVTGADLDPATGRIALTGYSRMLARFLWILYDHPPGMPFRGRSLRIGLTGPAQTESVAFAGSDRLFLGSERFRMLPARIEALALDGVLPVAGAEQRKRKRHRVRPPAGRP
jgi:hypothetical protein